MDTLWPVIIDHICSAPSSEVTGSLSFLCLLYARWYRLEFSQLCLLFSARIMSGSFRFGRELRLMKLILLINQEITCMSWFKGYLARVNGNWNSHFLYSEHKRCSTAVDWGEKWLWKQEGEAGERVQCLRAQAVLAEDPTESPAPTLGSAQPAVAPALGIWATLLEYTGLPALRCAHACVCILNTCVRITHKCT